MTPDPFSGSASMSDPGSWNKYAYTGGDPINRTDPNGLDWFVGFGSGGPLDGFYEYQQGVEAWQQWNYCASNVWYCYGIGPDPWQSAWESNTWSLLQPLQNQGLISGYSMDYWSGSATLDVPMDWCPPVLSGCKVLSVGIRITIAVAVLGKAIADFKQQHDDDQNDCKKNKWPGDPADELSKDPSQRTSPGPGWEWRGPADKGSWYNPGTRESLRPHAADGGHADHWDYVGKNGWEFRKYKNGECETKIF